MKPITVLIAEYRGIVRNRMRKMLEIDCNVVVVGEAEDGRRAIELVKKLRPDVVLMNIVLPRLDGLEATRMVLEAFPATKVLIFSSGDGSAAGETVTESDVVGLLLNQYPEGKAGPPALYMERRNGFPRSPISRRFHRSSRLSHRDPALDQKAARLTARETEVLQFIAEGSANKVTASELGIGIKTVEKHREHLMEKLDIHETAGLTRYAIAAGIIQN